MNRTITAALAVLLLIGLFTAPVAAQAGEPTTTPEDEGDDEGPVIDLSGVIEAINQLIDDFQYFTENWDKTIEELLIAVFFKPFQTLAQPVSFRVEKCC
mgnify:CR=1 FL=1